MLLYHPRVLSECLKRLFSRIFSHCEIVAFNSKSLKTFIFIYLRIPIIAILSWNPRHLEVWECGSPASLSTMRSEKSAWLFNPNYSKRLGQLYFHLLAAPKLLPWSAHKRTQMGRKKFARPGCINPPHFHRLPIEIYSLGTACKSSAIHGRF